MNNNFFIYEKKTNKMFLNKIKLFELKDIIQILNNTNFGIVINKYEELNIIIQLKLFNKIKYYFINLNYIDNKNLHLLFFLTKNIYFNYEKNKKIINKIMLNPTINGLFNNKKINLNKNNYKIENQTDICNNICYIDIKSIINDNKPNFNFIIKKIKGVWNYFKIYSIINLPENILENNKKINLFYKKIMGEFGYIKTCHPVNNKNTKFSESRDIKYTPNTNHFFSSNSRQPLHNDYAYYQKNMSPDWLLLYSLEQCEYGGYTSIITNEYLKKIIYKYDKKLYEKILNLNITYKYEDIKNGQILHKKILLNNKNIMNWNYFQIKKELNNPDIINIKEKLFIFLEKKISDGHIYTIKKKWNKGDGLIFNDHLCLHQRTSFLGNRWLKDIAIIDKNLKLQ